MCLLLLELISSFVVCPFIGSEFICQLWVEALSCFSHRWRTHILPGVIVAAQWMLVSVIVLFKCKATANGVEAAEQKPTQLQENTSDWLSAVLMCPNKLREQIDICCCTHSSAPLPLCRKSFLFVSTQTSSNTDATNEARSHLATFTLQSWLIQPLDVGVQQLELHSSWLCCLFMCGNNSVISVEFDILFVTWFWHKVNDQRTHNWTWWLTHTCCFGSCDSWCGCCRVRNRKPQSNGC